MSNSTPVSAHPAYLPFINLVKSNGPTLSPEHAVSRRDAFNNPPTPDGVLETIVDTKVIPTTAENGTGKITLTLLRPIGSENETLPVAVFAHGGGWFMGSYKVSEKFLKDVTVKAHIAVIYVEYSLSPEVKFPVALEEFYSSVLWVHENAAAINVDSSKISVFGDSAGGNLATAVTILLKRRGLGHLVKNQVLLYPVVAFNRDDYDSVKDYGNGDYILTGEDMVRTMAIYHDDTYKTKDGKRVTGPEDAISCPLVATIDELKGLPRCLILTAECDVLRDEGEHYARRLTEAGVDVCAVRFISSAHGFATIGYDSPHYQNTVSLVSGYLN